MDPKKFSEDSPKDKTSMCFATLESVSKNIMIEYARIINLFSWRVVSKMPPLFTTTQVFFPLQTNKQWEAFKPCKFKRQDSKDWRQASETSTGGTCVISTKWVCLRVKPCSHESLCQLTVASTNLKNHVHVEFKTLCCLKIKFIHVKRYLHEKVLLEL